MRQRRRLRPGIRIALLVVGPLIAALVVTRLLLSPDDEANLDTQAGPTTIAPRSSTSGAPSGTTTTTAAAPDTTEVAVTSPTPADTISGIADLPAPPPPPPPPAFRATIEPVTAEQLGASWHSGCPVGPESLRLLTVTHWGMDSLVRQGQLVVHADWAEAIAGVMQSLFDQGYPIERMEPISVYGGSDDASMAANNTSAFNCRPVTGGSSWSQHSYGWAIDINPIQNPYVTSGGTVLPPAGGGYTDRGDVRPGMIIDGDTTVADFAAIGWEWGGYWDNPVDYQHFSATGG